MLSLLLLLNGASPSLSKQVNITLAFVANYCTIKYTQFNSSLVTNFTLSYEPSFIDLNDNSGYAWYSDIGMVAAIEKVNEDASILPGVRVNVKRFTDCGPWNPSAASDYTGNSGGYAAAVTASDIAELHKDVIGVIGDEYSSTTSGIAEILSQYQIPYCANGASSPTFSDKNKYPYFWRTQPIELAPQFVLLLNQWGVKRVSILYQKDDILGLSNWKNFQAVFEQSGIEILSNIAISTEFDSAAIQYHSATLTNTDSRYNIISGTPPFVANIMEAIADVGLNGPNFVWLAFSNPQISSIQETKYLKGLVVINPNFYNPTRISLQVYEQINQIANFTLPKNFYVALTVPNAFDCVMMMLKGFDKLLQSSPGYTIEMLSQRKLQSEMNYTLFLNLNYSGATSDPVIVDQNGDSLRPDMYAAYTGDYLNFSNFALSNMAATAFSWYNASVPIFYDGSAIPPLDGCVPLMQWNYKITTSEGIVTAVLSIVGLAICFLALGFLVAFRKQLVVKTSSLPETLQLVVGCSINYSGLLFYLNSVTEVTCKGRSAMPVLAIGLALVPVVAKSIFLISIFSTGQAYKSSRVLRKLQQRFRLANVGVVVLELVLLIVRAVKSKVKLIQIRTQDYSFTVCQIPSDNIGIALYVINSLLFAALLYAIIRQKVVQLQTNDDGTTLTVIALTILLGYGILASSSGEKPDFHSDFRVALCVWAFTTISLLAVVTPIAAGVFQELKEMTSTNRNIALVKSRQKSIGGVMSNRPSEIAVESKVRNEEPKVRIQDEQGIALSQRKRSILHSRGSLFSNRDRNFPKSRPLQLTTEFVIWRTQRAGSTFWPPWSKGIASINIIHEKKVWLSISSYHQTICCVLTPSNLPTVVGTYVVYKQMLTPSFKVQMEFQDNHQAQTFINELTDSLVQFGAMFLVPSPVRKIVHSEEYSKLLSQ